MLEVAFDNEPNAQVDHLNLQAWNLKDLNRDQAISLAEQAIALAEDTVYAVGWASAQITLAFVDFRMERFADALERIEQATPIFKTHSEDAWLAKAYFVKGTVYMQLGDRSIAHDYFCQQLKMGRHLEDLELQALAFSGLGHHASYDNPALAQQYFEQALEMFRRQQNAEGEAIVLCNLASLHYSHGDFDQARQLVRTSFSTARGQGIHLELHAVLGLGLLGLISYATGHAEMALVYINQSLEIASLQQPELIPQCLLQIGRVSMKANLPQKALPLLKEALRLSDVRGNLRRSIECHQALAEYYTAMGQAKEALEHQQRYQELTKRIHRH